MIPSPAPLLGRISKTRRPHLSELGERELEHKDEAPLPPNVDTYRVYPQKERPPTEGSEDHTPSSPGRPPKIELPKGESIFLSRNKVNPHSRREIRMELQRKKGDLTVG